MGEQAGVSTRVYDPQLEIAVVIIFLALEHILITETENLVHANNSDECEWWNEIHELQEFELEEILWNKTWDKEKQDALGRKKNAPRHALFGIEALY